MKLARKSLSPHIAQLTIMSCLVVFEGLSQERIIMNSIKTLLLTAFSICLILWHQPVFAGKSTNLTLPTTMADKYSGQPNDTVARIKIDFNVLDAAKKKSKSKSENEKWDSIALCSATQCWKTIIPKIKELPEASTGNAEEVADIVIPLVTITDVYFLDTHKNDNMVSDHLTLKTPLTTEPDFPGYHVFVNLMGDSDLKRSSNLKRLAPNRAAWGYIGRDSSYVFYTPESAVFSKLLNGVSIKIPSQALVDAQVLTITSQNVGEATPLVDIFPIMPLLKNAELKYVSKSGQTVNRYRAVIASLDVVRPEAFIQVSFNGELEDAFNEASFNDESEDSINVASDSTVMVAPINAALIDNCFNRITPKLSSYKGLLAINKVIRVSDCETISPYVHIVAANLNLASYIIPVIQATAPQLQLTKITDYSSSVAAAVNGFTWSGDQGIGAGLGVPLGFLTSNFRVLATNPTGGNKLVIGYGSSIVSPPRAKYFEVSDPATNFSPYNFNVVSSSTSVIKNGICSTDATSSLWSAVGMDTVNNLMIMVSSISGVSTTAAQLCEAFQGWNITGALRLDGGPSTGIIYSGALLNPLTGLYYFKYGNSRNIAYPLAVVK
jgi:Phosphodiester glycosidase